MFRVFPFFLLVSRFPFLASIVYSFFIYMVSSSFVPSVSDMAELRANGFGVPIFFPIDTKRFARVSSLHLSIKFSLHDASIWVERKIYDPFTSLLSSTMHENPILTDNNLSVWEFPASKYRVYGVPQFRPQVSTEIRTPPSSSASTFTTPPSVRVNIEPGIHNVIHLSDSSDGDEPVHSAHTVEPSSSPLPPSYVTPSFNSSSSVPFQIHPFHCSMFRTLASMPGRKNILKKLDYNTLGIEEVNFLPPRFDGNVMFVLPPVGVFASQTKAKSMDGMDKRYDGHVWTKTQTTNITNVIVAHLSKEMPETPLAQGRPRSDTRDLWRRW